MPHARQSLGALGEHAARLHLERQGHEVVAQNWHAGRYGEIDMVTKLGNELVFVEVKTRSGTDFGQPEEAVNKDKLEKLKGAAQSFLLSHPLVGGQPRFDVVAVIMDKSGALRDIKHYARIG